MAPSPPLNAKPIHSAARKHVGVVNRDLEQPRKILRGRRGRLSQLSDLPLDLLYEIFGHLQPLDLLHVSRSCKLFRRFLTSRNSRTIWRQTLSRVEELPPCPPEMTEVCYASLLFSAHCHYCSAKNKLGVGHLMLSTRDRACKDCFPQHYQREMHLLTSHAFSELPREHWKTAEVAERNVLHYSHFRPVASTSRYLRIFNVDTLERLQGEYIRVRDQPEQLEAWQTKEKKRQESWQNTKDALIIWESERDRKRREELDMMRQKRLDAAKLRLVDEGWGEEIEQMDLERLRLHERIKQPKELTDREWQKMRGQMIQFMESIKRDRLERNKQDLITTRRVTFSLYAAKCRFKEPVTLPLADLSQMEPFRTITEESPEHQPFDVSSFPSHVYFEWQFRKWRENKMATLAHLMQHSDYYRTKPVTFAHLRLATTFFAVSWKHLSPMGQLDALDHPVTTVWVPRGQPASTASTDTPPHLRRLFDDFGQCFWNYSSGLRFHGDAYRAAKKILVCCGHDPNTTEAVAMDKHSPIISCQTCSNDQGALCMTWRRGVIHSIEHLGRNQSLPEWSVISVVERQYKAAAEAIIGLTKTFGCHLCSASGDEQFIRSHMTDCHRLRQRVALKNQPPSAVQVC